MFTRLFIFLFGAVVLTSPVIAQNQVQTGSDDGASGQLSEPIFDHSPLDRLLQQTVSIAPNGSASTIDYAQVKTDAAALALYLDSLSAVTQAEFDGWPKDAQLAFLINAYNAWTIQLIVNHYPGIHSIREIGTIATSPWQQRFIPLFGAQRSLDDIEHDMIRGSGRYQEPRIHFAVNCASIGCPALRDEAFQAAQLEAQLEAATKAFLADRSRNYLDHDGAHVSSIFSWYRNDFETGWRGAQTLGQFLARYSDSLGLTPEQAKAMTAGETPFHFQDYDWRLNDKAVPLASVSTGGMSPIWLIRAFPIPAALIAMCLLLILFGIVRFVRRRPTA